MRIITYWARPGHSADKRSWQPLRDHLTGVAGRAGAFATAFGVGDLAVLTALCHDLGKYSTEFQRRLEDPSVRVDHSTAGAALAFTKYGSVGKLMAYAIAGHHSGLPNGGGGEESDLDFRVQHKSIKDYSGYQGEVTLPGLIGHPVLRPQPGHRGFSASFFVRMLFSCLVDADCLDAEQFLDPAKSQTRVWTDGIDGLEGRLAAYMRPMTSRVPQTLVNKKRAEVLQDCLNAAEEGPGLFTLTVPTGGGKTLSSLAFALKHARRNGLARIIYVIPFTSIIEQNAEVFRKALGAESVLEHHSNMVPPKDRQDAEPTPLELAEQNWGVPLVVTTNVQFFESLFSNRPARCRKIHNIAKSVVILDEAQMLPLGLLKPCVAAIDELVRNYGATVVLCSATQPALNGLFPEGSHSREIVHDAADLYRSLRRVEVRNLGVIEDAEVVSHISQSEQILCIVNTRAHAKQVYELLGKADGHYHLSAAMCPVHRAKHLKEIRSRLKDGKICRVVSTQLIEAGVDVDFPSVIRAIAGIDSIAQAAGRCNREGKLRFGQVLVFTPAKGQGMSHVWFKRTASIASTILEERRDPLSISAVERYFKDLYFYEDGLSDGGNKPSGLDTDGIMERLEIGAGNLDFPFREVSDLFKVIGDDTVGVVVPYDDECRKALQEIRFLGVSRDRARRLQPYSVSVRPWEFAELQEAGVLEDIGGLPVLWDMTAYDDAYGLVIVGGKQRRSDVWIV